MPADLMRELLFPTGVWFQDVENSGGMNRKLLQAIYDLKESTDGIQRSNYGGWHSQTDLHHDRRFSGIARRIKAMSRRLLRELKIPSNYDVEFGGLWANINPPLARTGKHCHPGDDFSGAYYVSVPRGSGYLIFSDPRPGNYLLRMPVRDESVTNYRSISYEPVAGRIVCFPGWLEHRVTANEAEEDRVGLAFNLAIVQRRARVRT